jgi:hypothetical protein
MLEHIPPHARVLVLQGGTGLWRQALQTRRGEEGKALMETWLLRTVRKIVCIYVSTVQETVSEDPPCASLVHLHLPHLHLQLHLKLLHLHLHPHLHLPLYGRFLARMRPRSGVTSRCTRRSKCGWLSSPMARSRRLPTSTTVRPTSRPSIRHWRGSHRWLTTVRSQCHCLGVVCNVEVCATTVA